MRLAPAAVFFKCAKHPIGLWYQVALLTLVVSLVATTNLAGQANQDIAFADFQFNRSLPGARSLALGGAFVAVADDATAVYSNPAGLGLIVRPEVSVEYREWTPVSKFTERTRVDGTPTGIGIDNGDTIIGESSLSTNGLSFASYMHGRPTTKWAAGIYWHQLANYAAAFDSQGLFFDRRNPRLGPYRARTQIEVANLGAAIAREWDNCRRDKGGCTRIGVSVAISDLNLDSRTQVFPDAPPDGKGLSRFDSSPVATATVTSDDQALTGVVGIMWASEGRITLGAAYRRAPEFTIQEMVFSPTREAVLTFPDELSVGFRASLPKHVDVMLELDWIGYSTMVENNGFEIFDLDDGLEARLGIEKLIFVGYEGSNEISFMAGAWIDPDHRLATQGRAGNQIDRFRDAFFGFPSKDEIHWSAGVGVNLGAFQLDLAVDRSPRVDTASVSIVKRF